MASEACGASVGGVGELIEAARSMLSWPPSRAARAARGSTVTQDASRGDDCLDADEVAAFLHARLDPAAVDALDRHVARCRACRELLSALAPGELASPSSLDGGLAPAAPAVYAARDPELDREVARKVLHHRVQAGDRAIPPELISRAARSVAQLADPRVATLHDAGMLEGHMFLAIELIEGQTLAAWLATRPRSWRAVVAVFLDAGRALAAIHAAGAIHPRFTADCVVVGDDGRVRVGATGLPRLSGNAASGERGATTVEPTPEQLRGKPPDARSDQFRFCVALYQALAGQHPFAGDDDTARARAILDGRRRPSPPRSVLPRAVRRAIDRGLAAAPEDRYPDLAALLAALR
jgi:hypothetical protein